MKFSTPSVGTVVLAVAGLAPAVQAGSQHLAVRGSDSSKHTQVARKLWKRFSGRGSYYDAQTGNAGACGDYIQNSDWSVALNTDQYAGGAHCNQQVTITANGKTQTAVVKDACPGCGYGGLDLTPDLFSAFADHSVGIIQLTWSFGGSSGGGNDDNNNNNNNNNNGNDNNNQWTSTSTSSRYTPQWTPSSSSTPRWTPTTSSRRRTSTSSQWTPSSSSTWIPSSSSSRWSESSSSRSSSSYSSSSSSSSWTSSSEAVNSTTAVNTTMTNATATLTDSTAPAATGSNTALLSPVNTNSTNTGSSGALANMAQVVLRMANVVVAAADTA